MSQPLIEVTSQTEEMDNTMEEKYHKLSKNWTLYSHLSHDTDWSLDSYKKILKFNSVEETLAILETIPDIMIKNSMLFIMKEDIKPIWEDPYNRDGGCFSYKVSNRDVCKGWKNLCYAVVGDTITRDEELLKSINGITISPKKNFCIIKIWISNCNHQSIHKIINIEGLDKKGVLFKKQKPEY